MRESIRSSTAAAAANTHNNNKMEMIIITFMNRPVLIFFFFSRSFVWFRANEKESTAHQRNIIMCVVFMYGTDEHNDHLCRTHTQLRPHVRIWSFNVIVYTLRSVMIVIIYTYIWLGDCVDSSCRRTGRTNIAVKRIERPAHDNKKIVHWNTTDDVIYMNIQWTKW